MTLPGLIVRIYMSRWFGRFARKEGIEPTSLREAVNRALKGLVDADLGGGVIKQRVAWPGEGKSKGYRTILFFRREERAFFMFGFPKSQLGNINEAEQKAFREAARHVLSLSEEHLASLVERGDFLEVKADGQEVSKRGDGSHPRDHGSPARRWRN